ncbi:MAG: hypothetical protein KatS3mg109_1128 [Pirellulaceae bacterium]|nr:MAG: hypothetical protein KatS3mg109_1128 [Pirellulaceae bacterium]
MYCLRPVWLTQIAQTLGMENRSPPGSWPGLNETRPSCVRGIPQRHRRYDF